MYNTTNTRLAAALRTLGFTYQQPSTYVEDRMVYHLDEGPNRGKAANEYERLWRDSNWHKYNSSHPFSQIVRVAEARDWIVGRVIHDVYQATGGESGDCYATRDFNLAACIVAEGFYLLRFVDRRFYFIEDARGIAQLFGHTNKETALYWQCRYLHELSNLLHQLPGRRIVGSSRQTQNNTGQGNGQQVAYPT
jgi:hypothetical protein